MNNRKKVLKVVKSILICIVAVVLGLDFIAVGIILLPVILVLMTISAILKFFDSFVEYEFRVRQEIANEVNLVYYSDKELMKKVKVKFSIWSKEQVKDAHIKVNNKLIEHTDSIDIALKNYLDNMNRICEDYQQDLDYLSMKVSNFLTIIYAKLMSFTSK